MNIKIAVCDDEEEQVKYLLKLCSNWAIKENHTVDLLSFPSSESYLFHACEDKSIDILVLDIEMPGMNGMELAKKLRSSGDQVQIVFVTGYTEYMSDGYDVSALHYLTKPIDEKKFYKVLSQASTNIISKKIPVLLTKEGIMIRLYEEDINYLEASGHGMIVYTDKGQEKVSDSITSIIQKLSDAFIQSHRSYIVNLKKIAYLSKSEIILDDSKRIPIARGKHEAINQSFLSFYKNTV